MACSNIAGFAAVGAENGHVLWILLRWGWGNTAMVFALCLLPIVTLTYNALMPYEQRKTPTAFEAAVANTTVHAPIPILAD